jgi:2,4-dienoyl-CoA reductase (NADPH2)
MQQAVDCGVDMISVTVGWQEAPESSFGRDVEPGYWNFLSERAKKMFPDVLVAPSATACPIRPWPTTA